MILLGFGALIQYTQSWTGVLALGCAAGIPGGEQERLWDAGVAEMPLRVLVS